MSRTQLLGLVLILTAWDVRGDEPAEKVEPLGPGNHSRHLTVDDRERAYLVHVPPQYKADKPTPVVLALHGAAMNGPMMAWFSGLDKKSDEAGFIVVYPSGTGLNPFLTWNAFGRPRLAADRRPDDVKFLRQMLDDLALRVNVDAKRVYACGMSNGGMMCYRLAVELADRIAAIAPVAGTVAMNNYDPPRPLPVIHFHGSRDNIVPYASGATDAPRGIRMRGVDESLEPWIKKNGCDVEPLVETLAPGGDDDLKVVRKTYRNRGEGPPVVLVIIEEGGHTWPGQKPPIGLIGKSSRSFAANDLIWEFFQRYTLP